MATTNKIIFKSQVQEYVLSCLSDDEYTEIPFQLAQVVDEFKSWCSPYELRLHGTYQACFRHFLEGMPSCFDVSVYPHEILELYKSWFVNCEVDFKEPIKEKDFEKMYDYFYYFIFREFNTLCKKNGVEGLI